MKPNSAINGKPVKVKYFSNARIICSVDFPIFFIECISERHFVVAGGGGASKCGVVNELDIFELIPDEDSCSAKLVTKYPIPSDIPYAIMNASLLTDQSIASPQLATSGEDLIIYKMSYSPDSRAFDVLSYVRLFNRQVKAEWKAIKCIPEKILIGSEDGDLSIWDVNEGSERPTCTIKAHSKTIDEIDYDSCSKQVATLSRAEGKCSIWNVENIKRLKDIRADIVKDDGKYLFRSCKYANNSLTSHQSKSSASPLLIACNPLNKNMSPKICIWSTADASKHHVLEIPTTQISAMSVSGDARYVGTGSTNGSVHIFDLRSMKLIYKIEGAHNNSITEVQFLPPKQESRTLTGTKTCALLSGSLDRRIVLHIPKANLSTRLLNCLIFAISICSICFICGHLMSVYQSQE